jgi:hypothetical protein
LRLQAYLLFVASLLALMFINLLEPSIASLAPCWSIVGAAAGVYYYLSWRLSFGREKPWRTEIEVDLADLPSFAGSALLAVLAWREVDHSLVALVWLFFAVTLFEIGVSSGRGAFRLQACIASVASFAGLLLINLQEPSASSAVPRWLIVGVAASLYYYLFWRLRWGGKKPWRTDIETGLGDLPSFAGSALLAILAWREINHALVPLAWLPFAAALFETGAWTERGALRLQSYLLSIIALAALLAINLYEIYPPGDAPAPVWIHRWLIVVGSAAVYYYLFWRLRGGGEKSWRTNAEAALADAPSFAGTALLAILIWKESGSTSVALGWASIALALFEVGRARRWSRIELQGHAMAVFAFGRLFTANFVTTAMTWGISHRILTVVPVAALFYYLRAQTKERALQAYGGEPNGAGDRWSASLPRLYSYGGALLLVALARFELGRDDWIMGLALVVLTLVVAGRSLPDKDFRYQSTIVALLAFARVWATNVYLHGSYHGTPERLVTILPLLLSFVAATSLCLRFSVREAEPGKKNAIVRVLDRLDAKADDVFALLSALLCVLLIYCEAPEGWVTSAWALEALVLIVVGFGVLKRTFRYYGLTLLLACLLKLAVIDLSGVEPIYRILSYIVLGVILLLASFIYSRHRNVIKKYI